MYELATVNSDGEIISFINHRLNTTEIVVKNYETGLLDYLNKLSLENWEIKGFESGVTSFIMLQRKDFPNALYNRLADLAWTNRVSDQNNFNILEQPVVYKWVTLKDVISWQRNNYVSAAEDVRQLHDHDLEQLLVNSTPRILEINNYNPILWDGNHRMNEAIRRGWTRLKMPCVDMENLVS